MGKGCSLCVAVPMMCASSGCLWILHGEGGGVVLFWEGHVDVTLETEEGVGVASLAPGVGAVKSMGRGFGGARATCKSALGTRVWCCTREPLEDPRSVRGFRGAKEALGPIQHQD